jgi:hypothetical protein
MDSTLQVTRTLIANQRAMYQARNEYHHGATTSSYRGQCSDGHQRGVFASKTMVCSETQSVEWHAWPQACGLWQCIPLLHCSRNSDVKLIRATHAHPVHEKATHSHTSSAGNLFHGSGSVLGDEPHDSRRKQPTQQRAQLSQHESPVPAREARDGD